MGEGVFASGPLVPDLTLRVDPDNPDRHAFVEPEKEMSTDEYEAAIMVTRPLWGRWEE